MKLKSIYIIFNVFKTHCNASVWTSDCYFKIFTNAKKITYGFNSKVDFLGIQIGERKLTWDELFSLAKACGEAFLPSYIPLIEKRNSQSFSDNERKFQLYRRGRYVEFNLVWDRGTIFGLQTNGRTESILMSLPPLARWEYGFKANPGST